MVPSGDSVIQNCTREGVIHIIGLSVNPEHSSVDTLLYHDKDKLWVIGGIKKLARFLQLWNFILAAHSQLTITDSISENDDLLRQYTVQLLVRFERLFQGHTQSVHEFLLSVLNARSRVPPGVLSVQGGYKRRHRVAFLLGVVVRVDAGNHDVVEWNLYAPQSATKFAIHLQDYLLHDRSIFSLVT